MSESVEKMARVGYERMVAIMKARLDPDVAVLMHDSWDTAAELTKNDWRSVMRAVLDARG